MEKKLRKDEFTLEQFLDQMQQVKKLGSLETILGLIPGMGGISQKLKEANVDEKEFDRIEAIIRSMTPKERRNPDIITGSRRKRIALGCGMRVQDVNKLLKNFEESKKMMKRMQGIHADNESQKLLCRATVPYTSGFSIPTRQTAKQL